MAMKASLPPLPPQNVEASPGGVDGLSNSPQPAFMSPELPMFGSVATSSNTQQLGAPCIKPTCTSKESPASCTVVKRTPNIWHVPTLFMSLWQHTFCFSTFVCEQESCSLHCGVTAAISHSSTHPPAVGKRGFAMTQSKPAATLQLHQNLQVGPLWQC